MRVLMTGATGLIGRALGQRLVRAGHRIVAVSRRPEAAARELPFPAEVLPWEGPESLLPPAAVENVDAIAHLAGEPVGGGRWTEERKRRIRESRVLGTRNLVRSLQASPSAQRSLRAFVMGSAIGYYGDRGDDPTDETTKAGDDFLSKVCVDWEAEGKALIEDPRFSEVRFVAVRTGLVLSRAGGLLPPMLSAFGAGLGGRIGHGRQWMSWIHIDDIVELFAYALENAAVRGEINGVAPHPVRNETFSNALAKACGRGLFLPIPEAAIRAAMGEMASAALGGAQVSAAKAEGLGFAFRHQEVASALHPLCEPEREREKELSAEQWLPHSIEEVYRFFSDEKNLEAITPEHLSFSVVGKSTPEIQKGTLIDYNLKLRGVPFKWRTEISEWEPNRRFVDEQLKGPYRKWRHEHDFEPFAGGTLIRDRVRYRLPLGKVGELLAGWKVASDVSGIFRFRREKIAERFP